jgi:hypothetical protein
MAAVLFVMPVHTLLPVLLLATSVKLVNPLMQAPSKLVAVWHVPLVKSLLKALNVWSVPLVNTLLIR